MFCFVFLLLFSFLSLHFQSVHCHYSVIVYSLLGRKESIQFVSCFVLFKHNPKNKQTNQERFFLTFCALWSKTIWHIVVTRTLKCGLLFAFCLVWNLLILIHTLRWGVHGSFPLLTTAAKTTIITTQHLTLPFKLTHFFM